MAKMTVLEIVQNILTDMASDNVNSISDTVEAYDIATIVETTYFEIINDRMWPHAQELTQLTSSGSSDHPTHMSISDDVQVVKWIKYNKMKSTDTNDRYEKVEWMEPEDFINYLNQRKSSETNIETVLNDNNVELLIRNDVAPTYYTSFDDVNLIFDSYDSDVDSILQASKTQMMVYKEPTFVLADTHVPDLPSKAFPYLLSEAKSVAFNALKQAANQKEEQRSRRQRTWLARDKWRNNGGIKFPDYGRKK